MRTTFLFMQEATISLGPSSREGPLSSTPSSSRSWLNSRLGIQLAARSPSGGERIHRTGFVLSDKSLDPPSAKARKDLLRAPLPSFVPRLWHLANRPSSPPFSSLFMPNRLSLFMPDRPSLSPPMGLSLLLYVTPSHSVPSAFLLFPPS